MKTIREYIEQEYLDEINIIEESIFDVDDQMDQVEDNLEKALNVVSKAENCTIDEWLSMWLTQEMSEFRSINKNLSVDYSVSTTYRTDEYSIRVLGVFTRGFKPGEVTALLEFFKNTKCFNSARYNKTREEIIFKYNKSKDTYRAEYIKNDNDKQMQAIVDFKKEVEQADTSRWVPDAKNIIKMKGYMAKGSDPKRIAQACGEDKLVQRWLIAMGLKWEKALKPFEMEIRYRGILNKAEIEAYKIKYHDFEIK